jgi:hypothetical protein
MSLDLESRKADLTRMGYTVRYEEPGLFVASYARWYWDCMVTKLSYITLVRRVSHLTPQIIQADLASLAQRATEYDPSALPRGFQKGRALVAFYLADTADPEAIRIAKSAPKLDFASFTMAGILEANGNQSWYDKTALWGAVFYAKFHHLMRRLVAPSAAPSSEPISIPGAILMGFLVLMLVSPCVCLIPAMLQ